MFLKQFLLGSLCFFTFFAAHCEEKTQYLIGQGIADITGPAGEVGMMGYASMGQKTAGLHTRLWARAFVIQDPNTGKQVALVTADLGMIFQAVKREVIKNLAQEGLSITHENLMLTATHTHSGPGGHSEHSLYNFTVGGLDQEGFKKIVSGVSKAIVMAHQNLKPGFITWTQGHLIGASRNRSLPAYRNNPDFEKNRYANSVDTRMLLLRFQGIDGHEIGSINWFGVHATSVGKTNTLISSDNKGLAAYLFETSKGTAYHDLDNHEPFVAIFAQGSEGDVTPNSFYPKTKEKTKDDFVALTESAEKQFNFAKKMYENANKIISGPIDFQHYYSNFKYVTVGKNRTCAPALGLSFAAGAEDGPSNLIGISEGMIWNGPWLTEGAYCHAQKPILSYVGSHGLLSSPEILPIQIIRIGQIAIVGLPFEVTTIAGDRIEKSVQEVLSKIGVHRTQVVSLANDYAQYLTTEEEYEKQHYEGASNLFGPHTLAAVQQKSVYLAEGMLNQQIPVDEAYPPDLSQTTAKLFLPIVLDAPPFFFVDFGYPLKNPKGHYSKGETVMVKFWGGHPNNSLGLIPSFLRIVNDKTNEIVAYDWSPETTYQWERFGMASSKITITWKIPLEIPSGEYYIEHDGHTSFFGLISDYHARSINFSVE